MMKLKVEQNKQALKDVFLNFIKMCVRNFESELLEFKQAILFKTPEGLEYILVEYLYNNQDEYQTIFNDEIIEQFKKYEINL